MEQTAQARRFTIAPPLSVEGRFHKPKGVAHLGSSSSCYGVLLNCPQKPSSLVLVWGSVSLEFQVGYEHPWSSRETLWAQDQASIFKMQWGPALWLCSVPGSPISFLQGCSGRSPAETPQGSLLVRGLWLEADKAQGAKEKL